MKATHFDFAVVGGGVIGLSLARELADGKRSVALIERAAVGRATSWAGAGILPPSSVKFANHPIERLAAESFRMHRQWARELLDETGIDTGFRRCGALFIARTNGEVAALGGQCTEWGATGVKVQLLDRNELVKQLPALGTAIEQIQLAALVPDEVQIRNPDHSRALLASCQKRNVCVFDNAGDARIDATANDRITISTKDDRCISADRVCIAAGAWSETLLAQVGVTISTLPVRGQMLLYKLPKQIFTPILYEGMRYIVPRDDGHVLAGSTIEQVGFDTSTTPETIDHLKRFAQSVFADLSEDRFVRAWAGLRPATYDGFPYLGPAPGHSRIWVACGHFRSGLLLSTATAVVMCQLMNDEQPMIEIGLFRLDRG